MNEVAKRDLAALPEQDDDAGPDPEVQLLGDRRQVIEDAVRAYGTHKTIQESVYDLQKFKAKLMEQLHRDLKVLDRTGVAVGYTLESVHPRSVKWHDGELRLYGKKGASAGVLTAGDLAVAPLWGTAYRLDTSVPYSLKKQYLVDSMRHVLARWADKQILLIQAYGEEHEHTATGDAYRRMVDESIEGTDAAHEYAGLIAERLVKSFMTRISVDHDLPFSVEDVSVDADVEQKIDFIVHIKDHARGVHTELADVGVQFTIKGDTELLRTKQDQIERAVARERREGEVTISDRVLVSIPLANVKGVVEAWQKDQVAKGGSPDGLWSKELKETVFRRVLSQLPQHLHIDVDALWNQVYAKGV